MIVKKYKKAPDVRRLNDMKDVVYDKQWLKKAKDIELYYMYRGLKKKGGLRYDITVIPAKTLGKEYVKTKGHYHKGCHGELYMVLKGEAIYLMEKEEKGKITDVYYVKARKGDHILIPSHYAHVTINPSLKELTMANWVSEECQSDYNRIQEKGGASYFYLKSGWVKNKNYKDVPKLKQKRPTKLFPKNLDFLYGKK